MRKSKVRNPTAPLRYPRVVDPCVHSHISLSRGTLLMGCIRGIWLITTVLTDAAAMKMKEMTQIQGGSLRQCAGLATHSRMMMRGNDIAAKAMAMLSWMMEKGIPLVGVRPSGITGISETSDMVPRRRGSLKSMGIRRII